MKIIINEQDVHIREMQITDKLISAINQRYAPFINTYKCELVFERIWMYKKDGVSRICKLPAEITDGYEHWLECRIEFDGQVVNTREGSPDESDMQDQILISKVDFSEEQFVSFYHDEVLYVKEEELSQILADQLEILLLSMKKLEKMYNIPLNMYYLPVEAPTCFMMAIVSMPNPITPSSFLLAHVAMHTLSRRSEALCRRPWYDALKIEETSIQWFLAEDALNVYCSFSSGVFRDAVRWFTNFLFLESWTTEKATLDSYIELGKLDVIKILGLENGNESSKPWSEIMTLDQMALLRFFDEYFTSRNMKFIITGAVTKVECTYLKDRLKYWTKSGYAGA